tara:strand:- start:61 stop:303 length:243 start_codon:yes stop_codon:yes gene_type:complete
MNIETIREFLGWCTIINYGLMILAFLKVYALRNTLAQFRQELFGLDEESVRRLQGQLFVNYQLVIIVFNLTPYIALIVMT